VALKRLHGSPEAAANGTARARFLQEARAACAVEHPNVVQVLDFIELVDQPSILVMELLEGEPLASLLARGPALSARRAARLLLPVVSAVAAAHDRGIVHRDLKPANIFLHRREGGGRVVKVLDFGIAKWTSGAMAGAGPHTRTGSTVGTPCYMAPEQATGERGVDRRADVWSLGVILYECLSGVRPIPGTNAARVVMQLMTRGIVPVEQLAPEVPPEISALVGRMLSVDPARRPQDLAEVAAVLERTANDMGPVTDPHRSAVLALSHGLEATEDIDAPPPKPPQRAANVLPLVLLAAVLIGKGAAPNDRVASGPSAGDPHDASEVSSLEAPRAATNGATTNGPDPASPPSEPRLPLEPPGESSRSRRPETVAMGAERRLTKGLPDLHQPADAGLLTVGGPTGQGGTLGLDPLASPLLPAAALCATSRDCASGACVAFVCR
jgi:serine/threonine protein kinase